jgi:hypothetical protein
MENFDINKENNILLEETLQKKKTEFESLYNQQQIARENQRQFKLSTKEITKDPQEMMLQIQKSFLQDYNSSLKKKNKKKAFKFFNIKKKISPSFFHYKLFLFLFYFFLKH